MKSHRFDPPLKTWIEPDQVADQFIAEDAKGIDPMWGGRLKMLIKACLVFFHDHPEEISLDGGKADPCLLFSLRHLAAAWRRHGQQPDDLGRYLLSLPGFRPEEETETQHETALDQHGFLQMQIHRHVRENPEHNVLTKVFIPMAIHQAVLKLDEVLPGAAPAAGQKRL